MQRIPDHHSKNPGQNTGTGISNMDIQIVYSSNCVLWTIVDIGILDSCGKFSEL